MIFAGIALNPENFGQTFSSFNSRPSLATVTDRRKQFQSNNMVEQNSTIIFEIQWLRRHALAKKINGMSGVTGMTEAQATEKYSK